MNRYLVGIGMVTYWVTRRLLLGDWWLLVVLNYAIVKKHFRIITCLFNTLFFHHHKPISAKYAIYNEHTIPMTSSTRYTIQDELCNPIFAHTQPVRHVKQIYRCIFKHNRWLYSWKNKFGTFPKLRHCRTKLVDTNDIFH